MNMFDHLSIKKIITLNQFSFVWGQFLEEAENETLDHAFLNLRDAGGVCLQVDEY